mmetsp:Transcript_31736/g.51350  ORF Transcript_31736/g.51350 Transcript_31736/m.51350 type:complete len:211 (-) Transcript_31736:724-1356(-)
MQTFLQVLLGNLFETLLIGFLEDLCVHIVRHFFVAQHVPHSIARQNHKMIIAIVKVHFDHGRFHRNRRFQQMIAKRACHRQQSIDALHASNGAAAFTNHGRFFRVVCFMVFGEANSFAFATQHYSRIAGIRHIKTFVLAINQQGGGSRARLIDLLPMYLFVRDLIHIVQCFAHRQIAVERQIVLEIEVERACEKVDGGASAMAIEETEET